MTKQRKWCEKNHQKHQSDLPLFVVRAYSHRCIITGWRMTSQHKQHAKHTKPRHTCQHCGGTHTHKHTDTPPWTYAYSTIAYWPMAHTKDFSCRQPFWIIYLLPTQRCNLKNSGRFYELMICFAPAAGTANSSSSSSNTNWISIASCGRNFRCAGGSSAVFSKSLKKEKDFKTVSCWTEIFLVPSRELNEKNSLESINQ